MRACGRPAVPDGWLYAVGDVNGRNLLTHMGKYQARICGDVIAARANGRADDLPSLRDQRRRAGRSAGHLHRPAGRARSDAPRPRPAPTASARASSSTTSARSSALSCRRPGTPGEPKLVVDEDRRVLLGVTFVGPAAVDLLHGATIAVTAEIPLDQLWHAVPVFPTTSEIWLNLLQEYGL